MKKIKKITVLLLLTSFMVVSSYDNSKVEAKTFGELKQELKDEEAALRKNEADKNLTEAQMSDTKKKIASTQASIDKTYRDIDNLTAEIEALNISIKEKETQIKEIINFSQVSNGDSAYLEYIFDADDFTDFIYRSAVAEQLADYNDKLVDEFNQDIENNKKKQKEIEEKRVTLKKQQEELEKQYETLGDKLDEHKDATMDIEEQISYLKEMVKIYEERGCEDDEDIKTCGKSVLPSNTKFYRPLIRGYVTSEYGYRVGTYSGNHTAIDTSTSPNTNVNVYASGTGVVSGINKVKCGGNYVVIHHKMTNGDTYTTMYMHLAKVLVKVNDTVTKDTVVGIMGGGKNPKTPSNYTPWDTCTTGAHNHFAIATGLWGIDYKTWNQFNAHTINPRNIVNFPSGRYNWFTDRLTKY